MVVIYGRLYESLEVTGLDPLSNDFSVDFEDEEKILLVPLCIFSDG